MSERIQFVVTGWNDAKVFLLHTGGALDAQTCCMKRQARHYLNVFDNYADIISEVDSIFSFTLWHCGIFYTVSQFKHLVKPSAPRAPLLVANHTVSNNEMHFLLQG